MLVYKYRGGAFDRDLASLKQDYFWAANVDSLNDPCEATFSNSLATELSSISKLFNVRIEEIANEFERVLKSVDEFTNLINKLGIFSLSKNYDHQLLWAHYADSHRGFCIEYDLDIIKKQQHSFASHYTIDIGYSDSPGSIGLDQMLSLTSKKDKGLSFIQAMIGTKSLSWNYEEEVRLITDNFGNQPYDYRAVKAIFFGLRMSEEHKERLMEELQGRSIRYYQMTKKLQSYDLQAIPIADIFSEALPYLYKVFPVQEDAVPLDEVEGKWKDYAPYLSKAVEVQRRDPYCSEVCYAAFSYYDSKPGNPVVYVNYKYAPDGYMNRSFTINQIDELYNSLTDL
jgi:hypothetical protein